MLINVQIYCFFVIDEYFLKKIIEKSLKVGKIRRNSLLHHNKFLNFVI
jgi:hypothetical protein